MTLRTGEDILIWRRKLWIALCGGIVLEEALDLSSDRILNEWMNMEGLAYIKFSMYLQFPTVQNNILKNLLHINCFRADIFWGAGVALSILWLVYWLDWEILFRYPTGTRDFLFIKASILAVGPMPPATEWLHRAIFLEIWQWERAANLSPPPSTEVKNACSCLHSPPQTALLLRHEVSP